MEFKFYSKKTESFLDCDISEETETLLKNLITPHPIYIFNKPVNVYLRLNEYEETLFEIVEYVKDHEPSYTFYVREKGLKSHEEIHETLKAIENNLSHATGHTWTRIMVQWTNGKYLDPLKMDVIHRHIERASTLLRELM